MLIEAYTSEDNTFHWLDLVEPTGGELEHIAEKYGIPPTAIQDCLDPKHLPKYEVLENNSFIMLRAHDEKADEKAGNIQKLTQKIAIFIGDDYILTVRRRDQPFIKSIRENWVKNKSRLEPDPRLQLLTKIIFSVLFSYNHALLQCENKLEEFEEVVFNEETTTEAIQRKFLLKRQAYVFKRVLRLTLDILPRIKIISEKDPLISNELKEICDSIYFEAENVLENVNNLINLQLSIASNHTNDIMRVLTICSVFFLPLGFITGFFGMNFDVPVLHWAWGYLIVIGFILSMFAFFFIWFRRKGWF